MTGALANGMMGHMGKLKAAQSLGRKSAEKRHAGKSAEEIKEYYRNLRLKRKDLQASDTQN